MNINRVVSIGFSATGNTKNAVSLIGERLAKAFGVSHVCIPFTLPEEREKPVVFEAGDFAVIGSPVYAGKIPNKLLPDYKEKLIGNGALCAAIVTFGNRSYDNALSELASVLSANGFKVVGGAAFVGFHYMTGRLAKGRPDESDKAEMLQMADRLYEKLTAPDYSFAPMGFPGDADAPYYTPLDMEGKPAKFLKAKPVTNAELCDNCGICARVCPLGSIAPEDLINVAGPCIKCSACVYACPKHAKSFEDAVMLSHMDMVVSNNQTPKKNEVYL